jgi:formylglycine-generating enzyme required for sulfatase activity
MKSYITILAVLFVSCFGLSCFAACPSADLTGDCRVDFADFAKMAEQWLNEGIPTPILNGMTWVSISDPGVDDTVPRDGIPDHPGFTGEMSKYETTNAQYCQFLNAAKASNQITVYTDNIVYATSDIDYSQPYYNLAGAGYTGGGAVNGGAARINYTGSSFTVDSGFENHPVTYVSWYGATAFCNYYGYRLPTEWEWQAVADYDGGYIYGCGTTINNTMANYYDLGFRADGTTAVGVFGTYGYGMCDMAGNVWEWTSSTNSGSSRVNRGGSWCNFPITVSERNWGPPYYWDAYLGFRVCR